jgi:hypothetical protein
MSAKTKMSTQVVLDPFSLKVLNNFSAINNSLVVKSGTELRTMTEGKTVLAEANVPNTFPVDFAIYDLRQMLNFVSTLFDKPTMSFNQDFVEISSGNDVTKIFYCKPDLVSAPTKRITMPSEEVSLTLSEDNLKKIMKAASILGVDDICFSSSDDNVVVSVLDKQNSATNTWSTKINGEFSSEFKVYLKISNLKILDGEYSISISKAGITCFRYQASDDLKYYIAAEKDSKFD